MIRDEDEQKNIGDSGVIEGSFLSLEEGGHGHRSESPEGVYAVSADSTDEGAGASFVLSNAENKPRDGQRDEESLPVVYSKSVRAHQETDEGAGSGGSLKVYSMSDVQSLAGDSGDETSAYKGRIGERMVSMGLITSDQLNVALQEKKITGKMLGEVMVDLGFIDEETLVIFLAQSSGFELFDPKNTIFDGEVLAFIDKRQALKHHVLPVAQREHEFLVAMADPYDVVALDMLRNLLPKGARVVPMVSTPTILSEAIDMAYGYASSIQGILKELEEGEVQEDVASLSESEAFSHPIVRLVNALVFEAVKLRVSDLHFEPEENFIRLRYRKDGVLYTAQILHKQH